jgi:hypothetical protein
MSDRPRRARAPHGPGAPGSGRGCARCVTVALRVSQPRRSGLLAGPLLAGGARARGRPRRRVPPRRPGAARQSGAPAGPRNAASGSSGSSGGRGGSGARAPEGSGCVAGPLRRPAARPAAPGPAGSAANAAQTCGSRGARRRWGGRRAALQGAGGAWACGESGGRLCAPSERCAVALPCRARPVNAARRGSWAAPGAGPGQVKPDGRGRLVTNADGPPGACGQHAATRARAPAGARRHAAAAAAAAPSLQLRLLPQTPWAACLASQFC